MWPFFPTSFDFINEKLSERIKKILVGKNSDRMNWKCMKRDCVEMKIVQKQIHYLSSSSGFKTAISKSYNCTNLFTYILFHFFVTFKLQIV